MSSDEITGLLTKRITAPSIDEIVSIRVFVNVAATALEEVSFAKRRRASTFTDAGMTKMLMSNASAAIVYRPERKRGSSKVSMVPTTTKLTVRTLR